MKTIFILVLCTIISVAAFGQTLNKSQENNKVNPPTFTGINELLLNYEGENPTSIEDYLINRLEYPEKSLKNCCQGTEVIRFNVNKKGELNNFIVVNSVSPSIDEAVINLLKTTSGMWQPGNNYGKLVSMDKEIVIEFKYGEFAPFAESKDFTKIAKLYLDKGNKYLLVKNNPKKALKFYEKGIKYKPYEDCLLMASGICKYELGDKEGAQQNWDRMSTAGIDQNAMNMAEEFVGFEAHSQLITLLEK